MPRPGHAPDLPSLCAHLADCRLTPQYWPERVERVDELPRTASGKIQKFVLRERAAAFANP